MSIKDLFQNNKTNKIIEAETIVSASAEVEGVSLVREKSKEKEEFVPPIDYSTASNFAKFGSAELYYEYAFKRIQQQYPYDGTLAERQQFENNSTYLDRYIFENQYPRTNGFVNFGINTSGGSKGADGYYTGAANKEYIYILGGPHTASAGMTGKKLGNTFDLSTIYDAENKRENNLKIDLTVGNSIEFWLNKTAFDASIAEKEIIYDSTNSDNKHFRIFLSASDDGTSPINIEFATSATTSSYNLGATTLTTASVADSSWHHYAITMLSQSSGIKTRLFVDSVLNKEQTVSSPWDDIKTSTNGVIATIGAKVSGTKGDGQLISSSIDEFRFWKSERTGKQIGQNWFVNLGGGTDDSLDNIDLGIYFKFNEGITLTSSTDSTVLDYSGRLSNGRFIGYTSTTRNTGSAIILSGQTDREYKDPIIYSYHPDVKSKQEELKQLGISADSENTSLFYHLLPSWIVENDEETGKNIKYLCQIMASYFDTLHAQISYINKIKDDKYFGPLIEKDDFKNKQYKYFSDQDKPHPFSQQLLRHRGFIIPNLFVDATLVEEFLEHDVNEKYDRDIREVKNLIYQNLYNNILDIYKSKGTEKSFNRYLKNFGVDSELIKLNLYADKSIYTLRDNYEFKAVSTNGANFNNADSNGASVHQNSGSDGVGYIKNPNQNTKYTAYTLEAEVLFPTQPALNSSDYYDKSFHTASIVGFHRINPTVDEYTFHPTDKNLKVLVASTTNREHSKFIITGSDGIYLTSSVIPNVYDDQKWNIALRVKNSKYPLATLTGAIDSVSVDVDFYAVHAENNTKHASVYVSTSSIANGEFYLSSSKKVFAGAEKTNFTGSTIISSDVVVNDVKYWQSYIDNETIDQHAFDNEAFGVRHPLENNTLFAIDNVSVPQKDTLALHWDFDNNTQSDSGGSFTVYDLSSGSAGMTNRFGWFSEITKNKHYGKGVDFIPSSTKAFNKSYFSTARRRIPSSIYTSDMITIKSGKNEFFFQDDEYMDNFYSFEKSMQAVISDEVIKMFATVVGFNNLIGQPENKYRPNYKDMDFLRQQFFESIENEPDQEKFFEFYKWIDSSVSFGIKQLYPASARFSEGILNVIESHVLERPKHQNKFPILSPASPEIGQMMGVEEQKYTWNVGHAPLANSPIPPNKNCLWQSSRREDANADENTLRRVINTRRPLSSNVLLTQGGVLYRREEDIKSFRSRPYDYDAIRQDTIHGGINYPPNKNRELYKSYIEPHGPKTSIGVPRNVHAVGIGLGQGINNTKECDDPTGLNKKRIAFNTLVGKFSRTTGDDALDDSYSYSFNVKGNNFAPYNLFSASVEPTGYQKIVSEEYKSGSVITNLHSDTTDLSNEIPMQGPFTQTHVGGRQSRHIPINRHDTTLKTEGGGATANNIDDQYSRAEEWRILFGEHPSEAIQDGVFAMVGPDYGGPYPDPSRKIARWYRDGRTKKHFVIGNIRSDSRTMGNFRRNYEIVNSVGRMENNLRFRSIVDTVDFVEPALKASLPSTNVNAGLFAQKPGFKGNVFGAAGNLTSDSVQALRKPEEAGNHDDNNPTKSIIMSKFSAPGSFETSTRIYMDAINAERSPYNALPFRNLTVRGSGSGEHCEQTATTRMVRALRLPASAGSQEMGITGELIRYPREGGYSLSFWHKMDDTTNTTKYFYSATDLTERLYWNTHQLRWRVYQLAEGTAYKEWRWSLPAADASAAWKQYALSWNGSFSSDPTLYINAVSQSLLSQTSSGLDATCNIRKRLDALRLMDLQGNDPLYELQGALGQFAFWKTNLTQTNVNTLYNGGNYYDLSAPTSPPALKSNVLDYWRLGEEFTGSAGTMIASGTTIPATIGSSVLTVTNEVGIADGWDNPFNIHDGQCYVRVNSHNNRREGLQTNLRRHLGRFGVDPVHGPSIAGTDAEGIRLEDYAIESNFQKQHRNNRNKMKPFEYDVTPGRFASGSFSVKGISYTGSFASASFVVTGATVYGLHASGSFEMSGAFFEGTPASASFVITGANIPGTLPSNGSFTVKGAQHLGSQAAGSFTIPAPTTVGTAVSRQFSLPGKYVAPTSPTATFSIGGRSIARALATGSFEMSGAYTAPQTATGGFRAKIIPRRGERSFTQVAQRLSNTALNGESDYNDKVLTIDGKNFIIETLGEDGTTADSDPNYYVQTWKQLRGVTLAGTCHLEDSNMSNGDGGTIGQILNSMNGNTGVLLSFWLKVDRDTFTSDGNYILIRIKDTSGDSVVEIICNKSGNNRSLVCKYYFQSTSVYTETTWGGFFGNTIGFAQIDRQGDNNWHHYVLNFTNMMQATRDNSGTTGNVDQIANSLNSGYAAWIDPGLSTSGTNNIFGWHLWLDGDIYKTSRSTTSTNTPSSARNLDRLEIKTGAVSFTFSIDEFMLFKAGYSYGYDVGLWDPPTIAGTDTMADRYAIVGTGVWESGATSKYFYADKTYYDEAAASHDRITGSPITLTADDNNRVAAEGSLPAPDALYNGGVWRSFSSFKSGAGLDDLFFVMWYAMGDDSGDSDPSDATVYIRGRDYDGTTQLNTLTKGGTTALSYIYRNDSYSRNNLKTNEEIFIGGTHHGVTFQGFARKIEAVISSNRSINWWQKYNSAFTTISLRRTRGPSHSADATGNGIGTVWNEVDSATAHYDDKNDVAGYLDLTSSLTVADNVYTIRHNSFIDDGNFFTFGSGSAIAPYYSSEVYSTRGLRWKKDFTLTELNSYGPVLYNTQMVEYDSSGNPTSTKIWNTSADDLVVTCWIKVKDHTDSDGQTVFMLFQDTSDTTPSNASVWCFVSSDDIFVRLYDSSNNQYQYSKLAVITSSRYQHIAVVLDRSYSINQSQVIKIYIDGVLQTGLGAIDVTPHGSGTMMTNRSIGSLFIGQSPTLNAEGSYGDMEFSGHITQFSMWKSSDLTAQYIREIYNHGRWRNLRSHWYVYGLVAWWELGDESTFNSLTFPSIDPLSNTYNPLTAGEDDLQGKTSIGMTNSGNRFGSYTLTIAGHDQIFLSHGIVKEHSPKTDTFDFVTHIDDVLETTFGTVTFQGPGSETSEADINGLTSYVSFTVNNSGSGATSTTISETGEHFSNTTGFSGGVTQAGAKPEDVIKIDGVRFVITDASDTWYPGIPQQNVASTGSDSGVWNTMAAMIALRTNFTTVNVHGLYTGYARLDLTSSATYGATGNNKLSSPNGIIVNAGPSFGNVVDTDGGTDGTFPDRNHNNDYLEIEDTDGTTKRVRIHAGAHGQSNTSTTHYINAAGYGTDGNFWNAIDSSIETLTGYTAARSSGDFTLTAPAGTAHEGRTLTAYGNGNSDSFSSTTNFAGGSAASGIADGSDIIVSLDSPLDTYRIYFTHAASEFNTTTQSRIDVFGTNAPASDSDLWEEIRDRLETRLSNVTVTTASLGDPRTFTLTCDLTGSSRNFTVTPSSIGGGSVSAQVNGTDQSGAPDGGTFTIHGETFEYSASIPSGFTPGNRTIESDVSVTQFRLNVRQAIIDHLDAIVNVSNTGNDFTLTADNIGLAGNSAITQDNAGLTSVVDMQNGTNVSGSSHLHKITIGGVEFKLVNDGSQHTPGNSNNPFNVQVNTGDDSTFWDNLSSSINQHPSLEFSASYSGVDGDPTATFTVFSELTGTAVNGEPSAFVGASFTIPSTTAGGTDEEGARGNRRLQITRQGNPSAINNTFFEFQRPLVDSDNSPHHLYIETSHSSDAVFWNHLLTKMNTGFDNFGNRQVTASYVDNGNGTATFNIVTTASTEIFNNHSGKGMRVQYAAGSGDPPADTILSMNNGNAPSTTLGDNRFFGGQNPSGSTHGDMISVAGNEIYLVTASLGHTHEINISASQTDEQVWTAMDDKIDSFSNYSSSVAGSGLTRIFTVAHDNTGSGNSPNINSTASSFFNIATNFDGTFQLGATDPHTLTVAGVEFEVSADQDGESGHPVIIVSSSATSGFPATTSSVAFWNNLSSALNTLTNYDATYIPNYPEAGKATFHITASFTGSIHNTSSFSTTGHTFTSLTPSITGGVDAYDGVRHNDRINFRLSGGTAYTYAYNIDLSGTLNDGVFTHAPDLNSITASINHLNYASKNLEFWNILTQSIKDRTVFDDITLTVECNNLEAEIVMVSSVTGAEHNGRFVESIGSTPDNNPSFLTFQEDIEGGQTFSSIPISGSNFGKLFDNAFKSTQLPASDYQYTWTFNNVKEEYSPTGSKQYTFRYADRTGKILVNGVFENTLNFPTSSIFILD